MCIDYSSAELYYTFLLYCREQYYTKSASATIIVYTFYPFNLLASFKKETLESKKWTHNNNKLKIS